MPGDAPYVGHRLLSLRNRTVTGYTLVVAENMLYETLAITALRVGTVERQAMMKQISGLFSSLPLGSCIRFCACIDYSLMVQLVAIGWNRITAVEAIVKKSEMYAESSLPPISYHIEYCYVGQEPFFPYSYNLSNS